jgi:hypothetical protein
MGYAICKAYYNHSSNKKRAIKEIIELNYSDTAAVETFLNRSNYYTEPLIKQELVQRFEARRPYVLRIEPFMNGDTDVDAATKEIKIVFSVPMNKEGYSINYGEKGKEFSPIARVIGYSKDGYSFTVGVDLKPGHEYEFILTEKSFTSAEGYVLKPYTVKFKTK